jgi:type IV pilus assembly protein PilA
MKASNHKLGMSMKRKATGFSLIELLVVVAVILIIAAIAIPNFIRSRMRANEAGATANLRTICTANVVYNTTYNVGFAPALDSLGGPSTTTPTSTQAALIDEVLSAPPYIKAGYVYTYTVTATDPNGEAQAFSINADPVQPGITGDRHFYTDQTNVIRFNTTSTASASDAPIQ